MASKMHLDTRNDQIYSQLSCKNPFPDGTMVDITAEENVKKISIYSRQLFLQFQKAASEKKASEILFQFLDNPNKFLILGSHWIGGLNTYLPPFLSECSCVNSENFNRFKTSRRKDLENQMLDDIRLLFPQSKYSALRYLSLGAGGLLQDFINIGRLMQEGYKNIDVVLVDSDFHNNYDTEHYRLNPNSIKDHQKHNQVKQNQFNFLSAAAKDLGITLNISYIESINKAKGNFHVIQMIDFDDFDKAFQDMLTAHGLLEKNGRLFLAFDQNDLVFNDSHCVNCKIHDMPVESIFDKIASSLQQEVRKTGKQEIHAAFLSDENKMLQWIKFIRAMAQEPELDKISLTLIQPQKRGFFGNPEGGNDRFTKEGLEKFLSLLTGKQVKITLVSSFEKFKALKQKYDIISQFFSSENKTDLESKILWLKENHAESTMFFALQAYEKETIVWNGIWKWDVNQGIVFFEKPEKQHKIKIAEVMSRRRDNNSGYSSYTPHIAAGVVSIIGALAVNYFYRIANS